MEDMVPWFFSMALERNRLDQVVSAVIARNETTKQTIFAEIGWMASRNLSSGAHSRDPVARNDGKTGKRETSARPRHLTTLCREAREISRRWPWAIPRRSFRRPAVE